MSATVAGALKAVIEGLGLGVPAYRDLAPPGATLPYVTIQEGIGIVVEGGDFADGDAPADAREQVQVDLWQGWKDTATGARLESYTLAASLTRGLRGAVLPTIDGRRALPVVVRDSRRLPPTFDTARDTPAENLVRHTWTVEVIRGI